MQNGRGSRVDNDGWLDMYLGTGNPILNLLFRTECSRILRVEPCDHFINV